MIDINYELYKVFYHVASTLNFSEASKQLYISQSAVSQSIKTLERKLDQTLFIRSTKKVQLTPEGEILMRHVEPAMSGGIAYVYDPDNTFYEHVNKELVEYKNVKSRYDEDQLREMIQKHYKYTNSNVAKKILDDFGNEVAHFKKVVPHDYKRMMSLISSFEQQGLTNEQAKVEAFNAFKKGM